ncbi:MAG TPA: 3-phosphoshikimate 1-carboxyvinyltransferase [Gammaproteobacteria bacterium]|nr:3-phosphoshikimate 1-carboxyvinyltransferase [Gammaproteobacteria bacterium]
MTIFKVNPSTLSGTITASASKSHTLRAILFASLAEGESYVHNYLQSPDASAMMRACQLLGAKISHADKTITIVGNAGVCATPDDVIDCGNSGQVLRFIAGIAALLTDYVVLTGDHSIRYSRPAQPLIDGLNHLGVFCVSTKNDGRAPLIVKGPLIPGKTRLQGQDSQPVSALLIACAFADQPSYITVDEPGEKPWIDLTLDWFKRLGIAYTNNDYTHYTVQGGAKITAFDYQVPGDFSSLAFPIVAAIVTQSEICIQNVDMNDVQGDKKIIPILQQMGAKIIINDHEKTLTVKKSSHLNGMTIDVNDMIDAVPILAVVGCYAQGQTIITGAHIARQKECDRLHAMTVELTKMGALITEQKNSLTIKHSPLNGANLASYHDHRIVMSLVVAALAAQGASTIEGVEWVKKSYPNFFTDFLALHAKLEIA